MKTIELEAIQHVVNKSVMSAEEHNFTCEHVARMLAEQLLEQELIEWEISNNKYIGRISVVKLERNK